MGERVCRYLRVFVSGIQVSLLRLLVVIRPASGGAVTIIIAGRSPARTVGLAKSPSIAYKYASPDEKRELAKILLSDVVVSGKK